MPRVADPDFCFKFGDAVTARRRFLDITQTELADRMGITNQQMQRYEAGLSMPSAVILLRLATALGITPHQLLGYQARPSGSQDHIEEMTELLADGDIAKVIYAMKDMGGTDRARVRGLVMTYATGVQRA